MAERVAVQPAGRREWHRWRHYLRTGGEEWRSAPVEALQWCPMCPAPWTSSPEPAVLEDDYTVAPRLHPVSHPPVDAPLCLTCRTLDLSFFDPSCPGCAEILRSRWVMGR